MENSIKKVLYLTLFVFIYTNTYAFSQISIDSLKNHLYFLAADSIEGRAAGSIGGKQAGDYIAQQFKKIGIKAFNGNYFQKFPLPPHYSRNVIGFIEGSDSILKNEYIVLGAHYDHIGWWMPKNDSMVVYNGADDNASGTSAIIEIARNLFSNREQLKRSIIIIAFDAEERGLIGSKYFVNNPIVDIKRIKFMYSVDMIGYYSTSKQVTFSGCASMKDGVDFFNKIQKVDSLNAVFNASSIFWKDMTDSGPFYDAGISSIYVSTGIVSPYHKPEDDADKIDFNGLKKCSQQIYLSLKELSNKESIEFSKVITMLGSINSNFKIGIKADLNSNNHIYSEGPLDSKSLLGFSSGLIAQIKLSSIFSFQPELLYSYFGATNILGDIRLNAIEIPLLFNLMSPSEVTRVFFQAGPYFSYELSGKIGDTEIDFIKQNINRIEYGYKLGFGMEIFNFNFTWNFKKGLSPFYINSTQYHDVNFGLMKNSTISFSLGYYIY